VVWSLGYTGLAKAVTFRVVSFTCRQKGWYCYVLIRGKVSCVTYLTELAVEAMAWSLGELEKIGQSNSF
jgi:hypothetical protein